MIDVTPFSSLRASNAPVESSNVRSIGFVQVENEDGETERHGYLYVAFHGGGLYRYSGFPVEEMDLFIESGSKGQFFQKRIRENYAFEKITR